MPFVAQDFWVSCVETGDPSGIDYVDIQSLIYSDYEKNLGIEQDNKDEVMKMLQL